MTTPQIGPNHKLYGVWRKIDRAAYHLEELHAAITLYLGSDYYHIVEDINAEKGIYTFRLEPVLGPPSAEFGIFLGEVVHNLRSGLDNLVWQLALLTKERPHSGTSFPIYKDDSRESLARINNALKDVPAEARDIIKEVQPYHMGDKAENHLLWILHSLWNSDKHRIIPIVPLSMSFPVPVHPDISHRFLDNGAIEVQMPLPLRDQVGFKPEVSHEIRFRRDVTIGRGDVRLEAIDYGHQLIRDNLLPRFLRFFPP